MRFTRHVQLPLCLIVLFVSAGAHAQTTGSLRGTVKDASWAVLPHATVIIIDTATKVQRDTATDDQGAYAFTFLPVGQYEIEIII